MNKDKKTIYEMVIELLGEKKVTELYQLHGSQNFSWSQCKRVIDYKKIVRLHLEDKSESEIAEATGYSEKQVVRILIEYLNGNLIP